MEEKPNSVIGQWQRRLVLPVFIIMVLCMVLGCALQAAAVVNSSWASIHEPRELYWGFKEACYVEDFFDENSVQYLETVCATIGEVTCSDSDFPYASYFGNAYDCACSGFLNATQCSELGGVVAEQTLNALNGHLSTLSTARGLATAASVLSIVPLPFACLAFFKELKWGIFSMPFYVIWICLWAAALIVFNSSCTFVITYDQGPVGLPFEPNASAQSLYGSGVFLYIGGLVCTLVSCFVFWGSYTSCFQLYDKDGNLVDLKALQAQRGAADPGSSTNHMSTEHLVG